MADNEDRSPIRDQESRLDKTKELLYQIIAQTDEGYTVVDQTGDVIVWNKAMEDITGIKTPQAVGQKIWDLQQRLDLYEDRDRENSETQEAWMQAILLGNGEEGLKQSYQRKIQKTEGVVIWIQSSLFPVRYDDQIFIGISTRDVTEIKEKEQSLVNNQRLMEKMAKMAKIGGWDYDLRTRQPFFTQETFNIFGLPGPNPPSEEEGLRFYLPQSRARVLKAFEDAVQENRPYDLEVPFHSAQGTAKWVRTMGEAYFEDGEPVKVIGAIQDITDRKLRENKLIEREQKLQTLFDYLHESILILEGDRIVECNRAFLELTEYKEKELILRSFLDLAPVHQKDGESSAEHWKKIQVNVKNQLSYQFLWEMINKAGEKIVCEITLSQIPGETGVQNIRQVSIIRDVTLRQQDEDLLRAALQEKVFLLRELYHRTKNTMQMIKGMLFLQGAKHPKIPEIQRLVKDIDGRIIAMSLVHQKLYQSKNLSEINMSEYLGELVALILEGYKREGNKIQSEINLEDLQLKVDMAIPFGLIVNELLTNTLKYAFREGETGKIWVELKQSAPGEWTFDYSDNGQGFPPGFDPIKDGDLGLKMILKIAGSQLGGHGRFIPQDGVSFRMTFRPEE